MKVQGINIEWSIEGNFKETLPHNKFTFKLTADDMEEALDEGNAQYGGYWYDGALEWDENQWKEYLQNNPIGQRYTARAVREYFNSQFSLYWEVMSGSGKTPKTDLVTKLNHLVADCGGEIDIVEVEGKKMPFTVNEYGVTTELTKIYTNEVEAVICKSNGAKKTEEFFDFSDLDEQFLESLVTIAENALVDQEKAMKRSIS